MTIATSQNLIANCSKLFPPVINPVCLQMLDFPKHNSRTNGDLDKSWRESLCFGYEVLVHVNVFNNLQTASSLQELNVAASWPECCTVVVSADRILIWKLDICNWEKCLNVMSISLWVAALLQEKISCSVGGPGWQNSLNPQGILWTSSKEAMIIVHLSNDVWHLSCLS